MSEPPSADYPYDRDVLTELAGRLYAALPAMYRVPDEPPTGQGELLRLLTVLAGPLAVVRQSIEELHADLFVDTAADAMIPYLAEMVGTVLAFPDAASNRRDVRGTVGWRRRKGTPTALEEMAGELTGQAVVLQEGWKRVQLTQDLDHLRPERTSVDVRPAVVAEQAAGPLDALAHAVDVRAVTASTGLAHPRHVAHWLFPTVTFPLIAATPSERTRPGTDIRFAVDPLGVQRPLRARRPVGDRRSFTDQIPEQHFAATPERWFEQTGGFGIRVCGLPAAVAGTPDVPRTPSDRLAGRALARGEVSLSVLELPSRGWRGTVRVELGLVPVSGPVGGPWHPATASFVGRASVDLDAGGVLGRAVNTAPDPGGVRIPLLRLSTPGGPGRFFPGATLELAGSAPGALAAAPDSELAREGFLAGAVHVRIPPLQLRTEMWLLVAMDGSLYQVVAPDGVPIDMPVLDGENRLAASALLSVGPGAAWPPAGPVAEPTMVTRVPAAPGRGPAVLHGLTPLHRSGSGYQLLAETARCALSFAVQLEQPGGAGFRPFQQLTWTGRDPRTATWSALDASGAPVDAGSVAAQYAEVARLGEANPGQVSLVVRFECSDVAASSCPGEVAWTADDGMVVLIHLPQLDVAELPPFPDWPGTLGIASEPLRVGVDGSTWASESTQGRRMSLSAIAPIAQASAVRRRQVRWRRLCAWDAEDPTASPPALLAFTPAGRLNVDVAHGLFAFSADEPPQSWPSGPPGGPLPIPPAVTVNDEEGATMHLGALPSAREPVLDRRLARPTRLISRSGVLHPDAPADWHDIPRYSSLTAALEDVSARWQLLTAADAGDHAEVLQFEDSATYPGEAPRWPAGPADAGARDACRLSLDLQAAERERPIVLVDAGQGWRAPVAAVEYEAVSLCGIALGGAGWNQLTVPPARQVSVELCTVLFPENRISFSPVESGTQVRISLCSTAGLELLGAGVLAVNDSIVDAGAGLAARVPTGQLVLDRVSVGGEVRVRVLEASEVIFDGDVTVADRFHGCVRYSRVTSGSQLPQVHRVSVDTLLRIVSRNRRDPGWWRLREDCDPAVRAGAESGTELGAFGANQLTARLAGFRQRLEEFTPAGLVTGVIRID